jgi:hypothetical protein
MAEVTLRQAAAMVGVNRQTVYRMVKEGRLTATLRPDPTRPGPDGARGAGHIKVIDTGELLRVFGRLTPGESTATAAGQPHATAPSSNATPPSGPAKTGATAPATPVQTIVAMTAEDRRREVEIADREALRAELAAARDALRRAEEQLAEAKERESKLLDLAQSATRLLEHREVAAAPPKGFWKRVFGG